MIDLKGMAPNCRSRKPVDLSIMAGQGSKEKAAVSLQSVDYFMSGICHEIDSG